MAESSVTLPADGAGKSLRTELVNGVHQEVVTLADADGILATPSTFATAQLQGALTETAPATDIASSGLNGRLQRIAQRLTSLIGLLPGSLGQKTKAASLAVTLASDTDALPVTGTFWQATQPVSGTVTADTGLTQPLTDTQLRATAVPVSVAAAAGTPKYYSGASGTVTPLAGEVIRSIACHATTAGTLVIFGGASIPVPANAAFFDSFLDEDERWVGDGVKTIVATGTDAYYVRVNV